MVLTRYPPLPVMKLKTIEDAAKMWRLDYLSPLAGNYWLGSDAKSNTVVVRFDKEAGYAELFTLREYEEVEQ